MMDNDNSLVGALIESDEFVQLSPKFDDYKRDEIEALKMLTYDSRSQTFRSFVIERKHQFGPTWSMLLDQASRDSSESLAKVDEMDFRLVEAVRIKGEWQNTAEGDVFTL